MHLLRPTPLTLRYWLWLGGGLILLKLALLGFDPTVRFFLGDSESYLHSALTGWIPPDRSFLYGKFVRATAVSTGWLPMLTLAQSLCGVLTALLCARIVRDDLGADHRMATAVAVLVVLEPAQLFYERMVMAESLGTLCLISMLACGFSYLRGRRSFWLALMALAGIATVALRLSLLPVVLGFALLPPLVIAAAARERLPLSRLALHLAVAIVATAVCHSGYKRLYGSLAQTKPDYVQSTGIFRLGLIAPLVKPTHLQRVGLDPNLLQSVGPPLHDHRAREAQIWLDDGLIQVLKRAAGDDAERLARKIAARAVQDDIPGFLGLSMATTLDYFASSETVPRMHDDLGTRKLSDGALASLQERFGHDASTRHEQRNPIARYFESTGSWLIACLFALAPLALLHLWLAWRSQRPAALLLALLALGLVTGQLLFSHIVSFRYLHPFAPITLITLGGLSAALMQRRDGRSTGATPRS